MFVKCHSESHRDNFIQSFRDESRKLPDSSPTLDMPFDVRTVERALYAMKEMLRVVESQCLMHKLRRSLRRPLSRWKGSRQTVSLGSSCGAMENGRHGESHTNPQRWRTFQSKPICPFRKQKTVPPTKARQRPRLGARAAHGHGFTCHRVTVTANFELGNAVTQGMERVKICLAMLKEMEIVQCMSRFDVDICCLQETRKPRSHVFHSSRRHSTSRGMEWRGIR